MIRIIFMTCLQQTVKKHQVSVLDKKLLSSILKLKPLLLRDTPLRFLMIFNITLKRLIKKEKDFHSQSEGRISRVYRLLKRTKILVQEIIIQIQRR